MTGEGSTASDRGEAVLSERDQARYARHIVLPGFGEEAQRKLRGSRVLVVGAGGLGSPVLLYLAAAGVGHLTIIDDDVVDESNLQRQVIHRQIDVGRPKALSAREAVQRLDPQLSAEAMVARLTADNALELCGDHDLVLDCTDNFVTRYLASDAAEITDTPLVWGTILQYQGQLSVFWPGRGPMLRDLFPEVPAADSVPSAVVGGTFGPVVGQTGSMMATEAVKVLTGIGTPAVGRLVLLDALGVGTRTLSFAPDPDRAPVTQLVDGGR
ncbi:MAG: HesA/MoeB/ThiF family protein [Propionibacterium sp.]|nr:HesA/MoeB/ThiF family protein [Propionibacterium sp.]MDU1862894.1 HesA/MoeB/ThiF family protein [Propionibacterium sp.]